PDRGLPAQVNAAGQPRALHGQSGRVEASVYDDGQSLEQLDEGRGQGSGPLSHVFIVSDTSGNTVCDDEQCRGDAYPALAPSSTFRLRARCRVTRFAPRGSDPLITTTP